MKFNIIIFLLFIISPIFVQSQIENLGEYKIFYYDTGAKLSEGFIMEGKPNGYWKNYYEDGKLKSEGNRKNFELDSLWTFYDEKGNVSLKIEYKNGKKNGIRSLIRSDELIEENFIDDVKQGITKYFYSNNLIKKIVYFENGFENGIAREFDKDGNVISIIEYKKGLIIDREYINRKDKRGFKQGGWKYFYENGKIELEGKYKDDKKNGYFKYFDKNGILIEIVKYCNDTVVKETPEIFNLETKKDYYKNGKIRVIANYKNNIPEGIRREYDTIGAVIASYTYSKGKIIGEGIIDDEGVKNRYWKEFYENGRLKSEGEYKNGKKIGKWIFYYENGNIEQIGNYNNNGNEDGNWLWYFEEGKTLRDENFINGSKEGKYIEYDENDKIIVEGEYIDGFEEGYWRIVSGDIIEEGNYNMGMKNGEWKTFFDNGKLSHIGSYIDDNPNGKHIWYWENGKIKDEGNYIMGIKHNDWIQYDKDGAIFIIINYKNGIESMYDGVKIKPKYEE